ncbi:DUF7504 family protein [Halorussus halophilus]|uniref:DUF7504 family protein n=1 Tax=Halorussus halophilus TaxID=2650975 RepID=UPI00130133EE|nr:hypothetical protein [Halorussus halophilus]
MCGEVGRGSPEAAARFRHRLSTLKQNGSNILVVGTDALPVACERLLGESDAKPRRRLLVTTDATPTTARARLEAVRARTARDSATILDWDGVSRGTSADGPGESSVRVAPVEADLDALETAVEEAIETFEADSGPLSPAELRVCFDSLTPLVGEYERRDLRRFLLRLSETVTGVNGMAHYHVSATFDSEVVRSLRPLFDAVVEVRRDDEQVEQRWHLVDEDITTEWLPL